ncbi:hypothetical protein CR513_26156, partial [Mucuna pruriens]
MAEEDREKTTFITFWGTFCYKVMSFGLKNAGATYQRAMVTLFHDMMHKEIEVYVDDMIAKSTSPEKQLKDLRKLFARLRKYRLRLNLTKCTFSVKNGKLLGFVKKQENEWDSKCQKAFEKIKQYLENPPILVLAVQGKPLILYLTVLNESMGCMLGQQDEAGKERVIYYLSKKFTDCEKRYPALERTCCALVWATKRLRQYMLFHTTRLVAKIDPIKYILEKLALTRRITRWQMALSEYDIVYVNLSVIKGSALAEHLAYHPLTDPQPLYHEFPDEHTTTTAKIEPQYENEWTMWFDGASNILGNGIGVVLNSPKD